MASMLVLDAAPATRYHGETSPRSSQRPATVRPAKAPIVVCVT